MSKSVHYFRFYRLKKGGGKNLVIKLVLLEFSCLVLFFAAKENLESLANYPIMYERSIRPFRHLECQNPSIILDSIDWRRGIARFPEYNWSYWSLVFSFYFWPPRKHWLQLQIILSCSRDWYGHLDTLNIKICPLF